MVERLFYFAFVLIAIYLFIYNGDKTSKVISAGSGGLSRIFETLQGRSGSQFLA
jgi:hypothetical protein